MSILDRSREGKMDLMEKYLNLRFAGIVVVFSILAASLLAQQPRILMVNGKNAGPAILQSRRRTYVDVEILAHVLNGSVTLQPDRVILTIPGANVGDANTPEPETMSREFASTALADVALMREWKVAIETMISLQLLATGTYFQDFQDRAEEGLRQARVAASTAPDHQSYQLLQNEFSNLAKWAGNAIATRQALNATRTMSTDVLNNDVDLQKISDCGKYLGTMLVSLNFTDIPTCP